jgi:MoaA/NifB/PqqE/SkfB family radical SAM enzyme
MKYTDEQKEQLLNEDKAFCIFPWIHMYTEPDGRTFPCCTVEQDTINENTKDKTLKEIFNSDDWKQLRLDMLNGVKNPICRRCHSVEDSGSPSYRTFANGDFGQFIDIIDSTEDDGTVDEFNLKYIDVRFSNQCNFACASCGPIFSTKWIKMVKEKAAADGKTWPEAYKYNKINDYSKVDIVEQLAPHLEGSHQIYFAGGEPLIMDDHYKLLELLEEKNVVDTKLRYNTNISNLYYKKKPVYEYWKKFAKVELGMSIDAVGARADLIRYGTDWNVLESNINTLKPFDNIRLNYDTTVTILNIDHLPDMYDYILEKNLIKEDSWFTTNIAFTPEPFSITSLPADVKKELTKKLSRWAENIKLRDMHNDVSRWAIDDIASKIWNIIDFMNERDTFDPTKFAEEIQNKLWYTSKWQEIPHFKYIWEKYVTEETKREVNVRTV